MIGALSPQRSPSSWGIAATQSAATTAATTAAAEAASGTPTNLIPVITGITAAVEALDDPYKRVAVLEAQLRDAIVRGKSAYTVDLLRSKLEAARVALAQEEAAQGSLAEWRALGKIGVGTGIAIGAMIVLLLILRALRS